MLPSIMSQLGTENMWNIKNLAKTLAASAGQHQAAAAAAAAEDDDVPELVENFDEASKNETTAAAPVVEAN
jgi:nascent polypeptide-associated complex subunit beta